MKTLRYTISLRPPCPPEAQLIAELSSYPAQRRAQRVRELILLGLTRRAPPVDWFDPLARGGALMQRMKLVVGVHDVARPDFPIREAIARVHETLVIDFLREKLIAGLLGCEASIDIALPDDEAVPPSPLAPPMRTLHSASIPVSRDRPLPSARKSGPSAPSPSTSTPSKPKALIDDVEPDVVPDSITTYQPSIDSTSADAEPPAQGVGGQAPVKRPELRGLFT